MLKNGVRDRSGEGLIDLQPLSRICQDYSLLPKGVREWSRDSLPPIPERVTPIETPGHRTGKRAVDSTLSVVI